MQNLTSCWLHATPSLVCSASSECTLWRVVPVLHGHGVQVQQLAVEQQLAGSEFVVTNSSRHKAKKARMDSVWSWLHDSSAAARAPGGQPQQSPSQQPAGNGLEQQQQQAEQQQQEQQVQEGEQEAEAEQQANQELPDPQGTHGTVPQTAAGCGGGGHAGNKQQLQQQTEQLEEDGHLADAASPPSERQQHPQQQQQQQPMSGPDGLEAVPLAS